MGATPLQIEKALGILVSHYVPYSIYSLTNNFKDCKNALYALNVEAGLSAIGRCMKDFEGP